MRHAIITEDLDQVLEAALDWTAFDDACVLVTGANGFLPAYMAETLLRRNERLGRSATRVIGVVRNLERARARFAQYDGREDLRFIVQDLGVPFSLSEPVDYIVHAASQASPKYFGADPVGTLLPNIVGTQGLLDQAARRPVRAFLYFSSGEVYGQVNDTQVPTRENDYGYLDPAELRSCYAESKRLAETMCVCWHRQHGVPARIVRPFHTYGPGMRLDDGRVFADFVADVIHGRDIVMRSDGRARRAFCYLADATQAFFSVLLKGVPGEAYNVGNEEGELSIMELAERLAALFPEKRLRVIRAGSDPEGYLRSAISRSCPDTSKLRALGWRPATGIDEGFSRTIRSFG